MRLFWKSAVDGEAVYGYEVLRAAGGGEEVHLTTVKGCSCIDDDVTSGVRYAYRIRAYDLAGNRSEAIGPAAVTLPCPEAAPARPASGARPS